MHENFNTYYDNIDHSFWRNLCVEEGAICQFSKGEEFISAGEVARYIGYIKSGALKYVAYSFKNISTFISSKIHHHSYKCSHLHCNLKKNPLSETWDCPCHGSRFDENGKIINGPAKKDFK